jgi:hypothetical protein
MASADFYNKTWSTITSTLAQEMTKRRNYVFTTLWDLTNQVKDKNQAGTWIPNFTPVGVDTLANKATSYADDASNLDIAVDADYLPFDQTLSGAFRVDDLEELNSNISMRD